MQSVVVLHRTRHCCCVMSSPTLCPSTSPHHCPATHCQGVPAVHRGGSSSNATNRSSAGDILQRDRQRVPGIHDRARSIAAYAKTISVAVYVQWAGAASVAMQSGLGTVSVAMQSGLGTATVATQSRGAQNGADGGGRNTPKPPCPIPSWLYGPS